MSVDLIARHRWEVLLFWAAREGQLCPCFGISIVQNEHQRLNLMVLEVSETSSPGFD